MSRTLRAGGRAPCTLRSSALRSVPVYVPVFFLYLLTLTYVQGPHAKYEKHFSSYNIFKIYNM